MEFLYSQQDGEHIYKLNYSPGEEKKVFDYRVVNAAIESLDINPISFYMPTYGNPPQPQHDIIVAFSAQLSSQDEADLLAIFDNYDTDAAELSLYKDEKITALSSISYAKGYELVDEKIQNRALAGYYDEVGVNNVPQVGGVSVTKANAILTINAFRDEFYRVKGIIEAATGIDTIDTAMGSADWPTELVTE